MHLLSLSARVYGNLIGCLKVDLVEKFVVHKVGNSILGRT